MPTLLTQKVKIGDDEATILNRQEEKTGRRKGRGGGLTPFFTSHRSPGRGGEMRELHLVGGSAGSWNLLGGGGEKRLKGGENLEVTFSEISVYYLTTQEARDQEGVSGSEKGNRRQR